MFLNVWNWSLVRTERKVQNWVRRRSYYLNLCEAHELNTWGQLLHLMNNDRNSVLCGELRDPRCPGFYRLVLPALPLLGLLHNYRRTMKNYFVSSNNTKWEYEWTSTRRPVTKPVRGRRTSTVKPVTAWNAMREDVTGKEFTFTSWKTEITKCRRARTTWTLCKRRTGEVIPRAAKCGRIDNCRVQSLNWDLWIGKQSPMRCRGEKFGSVKIRDETKFLKTDMESFPGICH